MMVSFGLTPAQYSLLDELVIVPLKRYGARVFIFGSRATGKQKKFSDVDILFESKSKILIADLGAIKSAIEDSDFPFKVDLVNRAEMADSYLKSADLEKIEV